MAHARGGVDRILLFTTLILVIGGLFIFLSASLGLLAYDSAEFSDVAMSQIVFGLGGGAVAFWIGMRVPYRFWRKVSPYLFLIALLATLLVFVPYLGVTLNGARRWIGIGSFTFQPSEILKIAYVLYLAAWLSGAKNRIGEMRAGLIPFSIITGLAGVVLLLEPDTDTFFVMMSAGLAMFIAAGAKLRDVVIIVLVGAIGLFMLISARPYLADRLTTFLDPASDPRGASYQIRQSLLAIGAGEIFGRGFGQSVQKFGKLPSPISDSIFSVYAEEFGFLGSVLLIVAYVTFAMRGLWVAARSPDLFGGLVATGIVVLIITQSFINIAAMLGVLPLSGLPLVFISHGGSALLSALGAAGILLSVSRAVRVH